MTHRKAITLPTLLLAMIFSLPATTANLDSLDELDEIPVTEEEASLWDIASKHENNLGNSGRLFHDRHVEAYLESITDQMLGQQLDHLGIEVDFILVEEPTLSAWVYPYGTIAVHTGLLTGMDNEAQLASILAHEISHFLQRHSYRETISKGRQDSCSHHLEGIARESSRSPSRCE